MDEKQENKLLSIVVPAYNKPDYLRKCIESVYMQTYRPIEVIVSDDQSPNSLEPVIDEFSNKVDDQFNIKYVKPTNNLRPYHNLHNALIHANGSYAVFMPHDDWFTEETFLSEGVNILRKNVNCNICICNSILENSGVRMIVSDTDDWIYINGREFVSQRLYDDMHPSYSGVILNLEKLLQLKYLTYYINKEECLRMSVEPDEGFLMINLLASVGDVAINSKVVSVRGTPSDSYSQSEFWTNHVNHGLFIIHMQLYKYYLSLEFTECAQIMRKNLLIKWPLPKYSHEIASYFNGDSTVKWFMILGSLKSKNIYLNFLWARIGLNFTSIFRKINRKLKYFFGNEKL